MMPELSSQAFPLVVLVVSLLNSLMYDQINFQGRVVQSWVKITQG